ncbi:MAG: hypothetical protein ILA26_05650 [Methanobrevibacter sp.]|uniref:hypothetical protein n=1 Tax=Methanobrevibacter sp. TaxID=66852 RepID=UPI001B6042DB|nr:hypothetical protein [Methanobrevibacter sp.]MBP3791493.1 hypothetical protein [Methanobrevibacter sp.]
MQKQCDELVISLLFPPSDNVSGITVAKRIIENNRLVDVLHADADFKSNDFSDYVSQFIRNEIVIDMNCEPDWWECISKFIKKGISAIKKDYDKIYSRSWMMSNHFLACEYKFVNESTFWTAEFSDPLIFDLSNKEKTYKQMIVDDKSYIDGLNSKIAKLDGDFPLIEYDSSAYFIAEYLVYLFADNIIFTNENQRRIMLEQFPVDVSSHVLSKSEVKAHPTLPEEYYQIKKSKLKLNDEYINVAYFGGDYYGKRHFEGLFYSIESLNHKHKDKIRLYIFIKDNKLIKRLISTLDAKENIKIRKPLPYLEFLNSTTRFDVLVVNDVDTKGNFPVNPYLPSKLSDYLGSSTDIWAICEDGSTLSESDVRYKSCISDYESSCEVLVQILEENGHGDEGYSFSDDYYQKRLTSLNELFENEFRKNQKLKRQLKEKPNKRFKLF